MGVTRFSGLMTVPPTGTLQCACIPQKAGDGNSYAQETSPSQRESERREPRELDTASLSLEAEGEEKGHRGNDPGVSH